VLQKLSDEQFKSNVKNTITGFINTNE